jgi:hypothetical protein
MKAIQLYLFVSIFDYQWLAEIFRTFHSDQCVFASVGQVTYSALMSLCDKVAQWEIALKLLREMTDATGMQGSWAVGQASIDKNMD